MAAVLAAICFVCAGEVLAFSLFQKETLGVRLWLGGVFGTALWMWTPALFSFFLGFTALSQWLGAALSLLLCGFAAFKTRPKLALHALKKALKKPKKGALCGALCAFLPWVFSLYLLSTHSIPTAADGSLHAGQSTYGDMAMHLGFITSLSAQQTFPPAYSILPNTAVGYPFLCDSISSTLCTLGLPLRQAYMLPMALALLLVFSGGWLLFSAWLKDKRKAALSQAVFFLGGGFGFAYFMEDLQKKPAELHPHLLGIL